MNRKQAIRVLSVVSIGYAAYAVALFATGVGYDPALDSAWFDLRDAWAWVANSFGDTPNRPATAVDVICIATPVAATWVAWPTKKKRGDGDKPKSKKSNGNADLIAALMKAK